MSSSRANPARSHQSRLGANERLAPARRAAMVLAIAAPLLLGGAHPVTSLALWVALLALAGVATFTAIRHGERRSWPALAVALLGLAGWLLMRVGPIGTLVGPPRVDQAWALWPSLAPRGVINPPMAATIALRAAALGSAVATGALLFADREHRRLLGAAVLLGAGACMTLGLAQLLLDADRIAFVYTPQQVAAALNPVSGAFVNPNQAGALGALAAVLAAVGAWQSEEPAKQVALAACALAFGTWVFALDARGAMVALACAAVVGLVGALARAAAGENAAARAAALAAGTAVVGALAAVLMAPTRLVGAVFTAAQLTKADNWRGAFAAALDAPLVGYGPGGWPDLATAYLAEHATQRREWVESLPLQIALDHGFLVLLGLAATLAVPVSRWWLVRSGQAATPWRVGGAMLVTVLGVEGVLGLGHQAAGYAVPACLILGAGLGTAQRQIARSLHAHRPSPSLVAAAAPMVVALALAAASLPGALGGVSWTLRSPEARASTLAHDDTATLEQIDRIAAVAPGSAPVVAVGAMLAARAGQPDVATPRVAWLQQNAPLYTGTWGAALEVALRAGQSEQACAASRELLGLDPDAGVPLDRINPDAAEWVSCVPAAGRALGRVLDRLVAEGRPFDALVLAAAVMRTEPEHVDALAGSAAAALVLQMDAQAAGFAAELRRVAPDDVRGWALGARATPGSAGIALLDEAVAIHPDDLDLRLTHAEALIALTEAGEPAVEWREDVDADLAATVAEAALRPALHRRHALVRARLSLLLEEFDRARVILDALLDDRANDVYVLRMRARLADREAHRRDSTLFWRRVLEQAPGDPEATRALEPPIEP